jgi:hypothetical protein
VRIWPRPGSRDGVLAGKSREGQDVCKSDAADRASAPTPLSECVAGQSAPVQERGECPGLLPIGRVLVMVCYLSRQYPVEANAFESKDDPDDQS